MNLTPAQKQEVARELQVEALIGRNGGNRVTAMSVLHLNALQVNSHAHAHAQASATTDTAMVTTTATAAAAVQEKQEKLGPLEVLVEALKWALANAALPPQATSAAQWCGERRSDGSQSASAP